MHSNKAQLNSVSKILNRLDDRSTSNSQEDDDDDDEYDSSGHTPQELREKNTLQSLIDAKKKRYVSANSMGLTDSSKLDTTSKMSSSKEASDIEDIWKNNSAECRPASPNYVLSQFGKRTSKAIIKKLVEHDDQPSVGASSSVSNKVQTKYAITPFKLPKSNMSRLEVAFQSSARQGLEAAAAGGKSSGNDTDEDKTSSDSGRDSHPIKDQLEFLRSCCNNPIPRLAGGADKISNKSKTSVSDADTLVGDEGEFTLASKRSRTRVELL